MSESDTAPVKVAPVRPGWSLYSRSDVVRLELLRNQTPGIVKLG